ncbi:hypothetical protein BC567DRAFT_18601 [Phyllosticta citribraziliensis]
MKRPHFFQHHSCSGTKDICQRLSSPSNPYGIRSADDQVIAPNAIPHFRELYNTASTDVGSWRAGSGLASPSWQFWSGTCPYSRRFSSEVDHLSAPLKYRMHARRGEGAASRPVSTVLKGKEEQRCLPALQPLNKQQVPQSVAGRNKSSHSGRWATKQYSLGAAAASNDKCRHGSKSRHFLGHH